MAPVRKPPEARFWGLVDKRGPDDCWNWLGGKTPFGHGRFRRGGKDEGQVGPHIFSHELHKGPVPEGLFVLHECDNPSCVNPAHLCLGTQKKNISDCRDRQRLRGHFQDGPDERRRIGSTHPVSKLTETDIPTIRADERPSRVVAAEYGVHPSLIKRIRDKKAWKHV